MTQRTEEAFEVWCRVGLPVDVGATDAAVVEQGARVPLEFWSPTIRNYDTRSAENRIQKLCPSIQVSASGCTNILYWTVLTGVWIRQSWTPPFRCTWWPCSARSRTTRYGQRCFAVSGPTLWNSHPSHVQFVALSLTLTQFCALKTVSFCRAYETLA